MVPTLFVPPTSAHRMCGSGGKISLTEGFHFHERDRESDPGFTGKKKNEEHTAPLKTGNRLKLLTGAGRGVKENTRAEKDKRERTTSVVYAREVENTLRRRKRGVSSESHPTCFAVFSTCLRDCCCRRLSPSPAAPLPSPNFHASPPSFSILMHKPQGWYFASRCKGAPIHGTTEAVDCLLAAHGNSTGRWMGIVTVRTCEMEKNPRRMFEARTFSAVRSKSQMLERERETFWSVAAC